MLTRRQLIAGGLGSLSASMLPGLLRADGRSPSLVVVILRGGADGIGMLQPHADPWLARQRSVLISTKARKLDSDFSLHPAFNFLHECFRRGELLALHAVATPYRKRSHFDAQDCLENGTADPDGAKDGWLNRCLQNLERAHGLAIGNSIPLILSGKHVTSTWEQSGMRDPKDGLLDQLSDLYSKDDRLSQSFADALISDARFDNLDGQTATGTRLKVAMEIAARSIVSAGQAQIVVADDWGWDTHQAQGADQGRLAVKIDRLDRSLLALKNGLGDRWRDVVVAVITEFGRTVKVNGTHGSDHGVASCAFLAGGAVRGGRVLTDWPGLNDSALYQGRDLRPTIDLRAPLAGMLRDHMALPKKAVNSVFPGLLAPTRDLVR